MRELVNQLHPSLISHYAWKDLGISQNFCSIIMAQSGVVALKDFGRKIGFMDTTFGTNRYGYGFTSLVVKDAHGNHFPVAYMIHYDETEEIYTRFLKKIKEKAGFLPEGIITDMAKAGKLACSDTYICNLHL